MSFLVTLSSIQEPRSGMIQQLWSLRSALVVSIEKSTPGERCSWLTITRSEPLMMNSPPPIITGISPRYTSSSIGSGLTRRRRTLNG